MALSLAFPHRVRSGGVALPALMVVAEVSYRRHRRPALPDLARRWAKGTAILFAMGAVSGTIQSFELGPALAAVHGVFEWGEIIGLPASLEEAAPSSARRSSWSIYLYGWERVSPRPAPLVRGGGHRERAQFSALFCACWPTAWMNAPSGGSRCRAACRSTSTLWRRCSAWGGRSRSCTSSSPVISPRRWPWRPSTRRSSCARRTAAFTARRSASR